MMSKNTHPHGEQLSAYIDSMLDVSRMRGIGEHLRQCAACRSTEEELRRTKYLVRGLPDPLLPDAEFWTSAYRNLRVDDRERAVTSQPFWQAWRGAEQRAHRRWAAGLAAAAAVGILLAGPLAPAPTSLSAPSVRTLIPVQDVSPDVSSLVELHTDSVSCLPLADPDRQKMIAADVQQPPPDTSAAGYADASF
jgi:anti-sigma factor RsiW